MRSGPPALNHSPAVADRVAPLRDVVRAFSFRPPARRLISTVTGAEVTAGDDIAVIGQMALRPNMIVITATELMAKIVTAFCNTIPRIMTEAGNCRIRSHLCAQLGQTAPVWGKLGAPWAEYVARMLWATVSQSKSLRSSNPPTSYSAASS